ncbi:hypothetical protein [Kitasatospora sp. NPDC051914]|uniref:hypothetical protein n=1 Tax=Kitasatospora sp. NPDC051914 TaxID=3154945 RepID=UPI0034482ED8
MSAFHTSEGTGGAPSGSWWQRRRLEWIVCLAAELRGTWGHDFAEGLPDADDLLVLVRRTAGQAAAAAADRRPAAEAVTAAIREAAQHLADAVPALEAAARLWPTRACALACAQLGAAARSMADAAQALGSAAAPPSSDPDL